MADEGNNVATFLVHVGIFLVGVVVGMLVMKSGFF
jgi:hypothetical protein